MEDPPTANECPTNPVGTHDFEPLLKHETYILEQCVYCDEERGRPIDS